ncbi:MAG TPA: GreA/GreB family elongation factor [Thermomicrobiales bacterium]|nr:GreA/GreB family elongation factor [Thermomicrobiales bacterium]
MNEAMNVLLTPDGWQRLHDELATLRERRRAAQGEAAPWQETAHPDDLAAQLHFGEIAYLDGRIADLHALLGRAAVIERGAREAHTADLGSRVTVRWPDGDEETYVLVSPVEVAPRRGLISVEAPVGQALLGRRRGERVEVATPNGPAHLTVVALA